MKFEVGNKVKVRSWEAMREEFGLDKNGNIPCERVFVKEMKEHCGELRMVKEAYGKGPYILEGCERWKFSDDMLVAAELTKSDLKDGWVCETRNGERFIWLNVAMRGITLWCSETKENLRARNSMENDIVKVYETGDEGPIEDILKNPGELIWERCEEPKKVTWKEVEEILKEKYPEAAGFNIRME